MGGRNEEREGGKANCVNRSREDCRDDARYVLVDTKMDDCVYLGRIYKIQDEGPPSRPLRHYKIEQKLFKRP